MAVEFSRTPALSVPGREVTLGFRLTEGGSHVRLHVISAPVGSALRNKLEELGAETLLVHSGAVRERFSFTPDVGGIYTFRAVEVARGTIGGGAYQGDMNATPTDREIRETLFEIVVGERVTIGLGTGADTAQLVLWLFGDSIVPTTREDQGEGTPSVQQTSSVKARAAASDPGVAGAVQRLSGMTAEEAVGDLGRVALNIAESMGAHVRSTSVHHSLDDENDPPRGVSDPGKLSGLRDVLAQLRKAFRAHMDTTRSSQINGDRPGAGTYHSSRGLGAADWQSAFFVEQAGTGPLDDMQVLADTWRAYEEHRLSPVHRAPDAQNRLEPLPALLELHHLFFQALRESVPPAPADLSGVLTLVEKAGALPS